MGKVINIRKNYVKINIPFRKKLSSCVTTAILGGGFKWPPKSGYIVGFSEYLSSYEIQDKHGDIWFVNPEYVKE